MSGSDISSIGSCCPGLTELVLRNVVGTGESVSGLAALQSSLQSVHVQGEGFGNEAAAVVAQITNLQSLRWGRSALSEAALACIS
jgi:hypothetical protein